MKEQGVQKERSTRKSSSQKKKLKKKKKDPGEREGMNSLAKEKKRR